MKSSKKRSSPLYVYVAGPLSTGGYAQATLNIVTAIKIGDAILRMKAIPFIPHLDHLWQLLSPKDYEVWMRWDFAWLAKCDVLFRIAGASEGADREEEFAKQHGIPVVHSLFELLKLQGRTSTR